MFVFYLISVKFPTTDICMTILQEKACPLEVIHPHVHVCMGRSPALGMLLSLTQNRAVFARRLLHALHHI